MSAGTIPHCDDPRPAPQSNGDIGAVGEAHRNRLAGLGVLLASIAHEINNVLTPALCYSQLAQRAPDDAELARKAVGEAVAGIGRAHEIANLILRLSAPGGPGIAENRASVEDAILAAVRILKGRIERAKVDLSLRVTPHLTAAVEPLCLEQVLVNLLTNALQAVGTNGHVSIEAECSVRNTHSQAVIRLTDSGSGMPSSVLAGGFAPFSKGESNSGHGLGLSICRRLVEASGGRLVAQSEAGKGTAVTLELPLAA